MNAALRFALSEQIHVCSALMVSIVEDNEDEDEMVPSSQPRERA